MTNYNDGNWHGWNGGECPVHPKSEVEGIYLDDGDTTDESPVSDVAVAFDWIYENKFKLIAFRVVKAYREPREFWIADIKGWKFSSAREAKTAFPGCDPIHVREVTE